MMRIPRDVEYALIALKTLHSAVPGEAQSVRAICSEYKLPFDAASHVLQKLKRAGVVRSQQGSRGGYQLIRDLSHVSFKELLEICGASTHLMTCMEEPCSCSLVGTCNIISPLAALDQRLAEFYQGITIAELLGARSAHEKRIKLRFAEQSERVEAGQAAAS